MFYRVDIICFIYLLKSQFHKMKEYILALLIIIGGCKSTQKTSKSIENKQAEIEIAISDVEIAFNIKNISEEEFSILNPRKLSMQKFEDSNWQNLKILICPCDAPCNAPEEIGVVKPGSAYMIVWNKKESWCGKRTEHGVRETVETIASSGKYRFTIMLEKNGKSVEIVKEFEIK